MQPKKNIIDDVKRRGPCRDRRNVHYNQYKRVVETSTKVGVGWSNNNNTQKIISVFVSNIFPETEGPYNNKSSVVELASCQTDELSDLERKSK